MKYLCLLYFDGKKIEALSGGEKKTLDRESLAHNRDLDRRGHFITAEALQSPETAATVRMKDGKLSATDGPFIELKEHLGGFVLLEADDLNQAIRLAGEIPLVHLGAAAELRPIYLIPDPDA